jgi:hypothetical protein
MKVVDAVLCGCGCGQEIPTKDERGRRRSYVGGHNRIGKSNTWKMKPTVLKRTSHERAVKSKQDIRSCEWVHIGGCNGLCDVAHVDGNHFNNEPGNLLRLCRSHHRLLDNGRIDPANPVMPEFVIRGGKRRYLYSYRWQAKQTAKTGSDGK